MKRFYDSVAVVAADAGYGIALDGKPVRTPAKTALAVPTRALAAALPPPPRARADAIAAEGRAQGEEIDLAALPLTRLASTALDLVAPRRAEVAADVARY